MIFFLAACFSIQRFDTNIYTKPFWKEDFQSKPFERAWAYSQERDGRALLVLENDTLIYSAYHPLHNPSTPAPFWSGTKTISCLLAYDAHHKGILSLDELVRDTIPEWRDDPQKSTIRIKDLLQFTSGLEQRFWGLTLDGFQEPRKQKIADKYQFAIDFSVVSPPGKSWSYGSSHLTVFAALFHKKTGMDLQDWLQKEIFPKLNFQYAGWNTDKKGQSMLAYGLWTTAPELLKLGILMRDDGSYLGTQVLPSGLTDFCTQASSVNPAYGLGIWKNKDMPDDLEFPNPMFQKEGYTPIFHESGMDILAFAGAKGQRIYIIPHLHWVVVHQAQEGDEFSDTVFLSLLLHDKLQEQSP